MTLHFLSKYGILVDRGHNSLCAEQDCEITTLFRSPRVERKGANMRKQKFGVVFLLAFLIAITMMCATCVSAHSFTDIEENDPFGDAVDLLSSIGVIRGTSATTFEPDRPVQRWQMALLLTKLTTGNVNDNDWYTLDEGSRFSFSDINSSQYMNAIRYADENGIIIGDGSGHFYPTGGITLQDAVTMTVRALGYPRAVYDPAYPQSYLQLGATLGLTDRLEQVESTAALTRAQTAQLLANAFTAKRYTGYGGTLAETVFRYTDCTLVLTATSDLRINPSLAYQSEGTLAFNELKTDGTFGTAHFIEIENLNAFPEAAALLTDPDACIGASYHITATGDMSSVIAFEAKNTASFETVSVSGGNVVLDGHSYRTVTAYSYRLSEATVPASRELIVYGFGEMYATGAVISATEMASYTDCCTITAYDDNGDGYWDRALFFPYSYGRLRIDDDTITVTKSDGKTITIDRGTAFLSGIAPADGANVLYSYLLLNSGRVRFHIQKTALVVSAAITDYDLSLNTPTIDLRISETDALVHCSLGARIGGAQSASLSALLQSSTAHAYVGQTAAFALLNQTVIALSLEESDLYGRLNPAALGQTPYAVVRSVNGNQALLSFDADVQHTVTVKTVSGLDPLSASASMLAPYDIVSYTVLADGTYALKPVTLPVFRADDDRYRLYTETDSAGKWMLTIAHNDEAEEIETVIASFPIAESAKILKYTEIDGEIWLGAYLEIPDGYAIYLTTGTAASNDVAFVYIKPVSAANPSADDEIPLPNPGEVVTSSSTDTDFTGIVYLNGNYQKISDSLYAYRGYSLADLTATSSEPVSVFSSCKLGSSGYYKCRSTPSGMLYVSELHRITGSVHNRAQTLYFIPNTSLQVLSEAYFRIGNDLPLLYRGTVHAAVTFGDNLIISSEYLTGPCHVLVSYSTFRQVTSLSQIMIGN